MPFGDATAQPSAAPSSALDAYMANYGQRLQSMLAGEAGGGALGGAPVMGPMDEQGMSQDALGPDLYQGYQVGEGARFLPQGRPAQAAPPPTGGNDGQPAGAAALPAPAPAAAGPVMGRPPQDQSALSANATPQQRRVAFAQGSGNSAPRSALASSDAGAGSASALDTSDGQTPGQQQGGAQGGKPTSFRDLWNGLAAKDRKQQTDALARQLKAGQQTINSAYATMVKQLGVRPSTELSRTDKGMLLMEFGLRMMQHSASPAQGGYGKNFGAAMGAAGAETMQQAFGLRQQKEQRAYNFDRLRQQMAMAHGRDLSALQSRSVLEAGRDYRAMNREDSLMARSALMQEGAGQRQQSALQERENEFLAAETGRNDRAAAGQAGANARNQARIDAANGRATGRGTGALTPARIDQLADASADKWLSINRENFAGWSPQQLQAEHDRMFNLTSQRLRQDQASAAPRSALAPTGATPPAGNRPPAGTAPPTIASDADYARLGHGIVFRGPDGKLRRKP